MHCVTDLIPDAAQPRNSSVRGFGDGALDIEFEHGLGRGCPLFCEPQFGRLAGSWWILTPDVVNGGMVCVGRPVFAVAEIGSCYLAAELGIPMAETSENHQAYVAGWLQGLQNDHRFIFQASSQASKAADYILSFSREPVEEPDAVLV
jgi:hypothetical protein